MTDKKMTVDEAVEFVVDGMTRDPSEFDGKRGIAGDKDFFWCVIKKVIVSQCDQAVEEYKASKLPKLNGLASGFLKSALGHFEYDLENYLAVKDNLTNSIDEEFGHKLTTFGDLKTIIDYFRNYPPLGWLPITDEQKDGRDWLLGGYKSDGTWRYFRDYWRDYYFTPRWSDRWENPPTHYLPIDLVPLPEMGEKE